MPKAESRWVRSRAGARPISSASHPLVKVYRRALADGTTREGWLGIEGPLLLEEALRSPATIHGVLVAATAEPSFASLISALPRTAEVARVPDRLFDKLARTESPRGLAALVELPRYDLSSILHQEGALLLVACGLQDPGNLGSMMRSAYALGAQALLALKSTVSPFNPKAVRASAGAIFHLPLLWNLEAPALFRQLEQPGITSVAADCRAPTPLHAADLRGRVAFFIGQEAGGLEEAVRCAAAIRVRIPMQPGVDSLNAASATAILLYEAIRQRQLGRPSTAWGYADARR